MHCQLHVKLATQSSVKSQRSAPFAFQILFSSSPFGWWIYLLFRCFRKCLTRSLQRLGFYLFVLKRWDQGFKLSSSKMISSWWGVTEFAQPYIHMDVWSVLCQLSTSSRFTCLKEIFLEDTPLPEVTTRDAHVRLLLPPSFSQFLPFSDELRSSVVCKMWFHRAILSVVAEKTRVVLVWILVLVRVIEVWLCWLQEQSCQSLP